MILLAAVQFMSLRVLDDKTVNWMGDRGKREREIFEIKHHCCLNIYYSLSPLIFHIISCYF